MVLKAEEKLTRKTSIARGKSTVRGSEKFSTTRGINNGTKKEEGGDVTRDEALLKTIHEYRRDGEKPRGRGTFGWRGTFG